MRDTSNTTYLSAAPSCATWGELSLHLKGSRQHGGELFRSGGAAFVALPGSDHWRGALRRDFQRGCDLGKSRAFIELLFDSRCEIGKGTVAVGDD